MSHYTSRSAQLTESESSPLALKLGLTTVGHTGSYAWGDLPSWAVGASLLSNGESGNQESPV